ncbi:hypothetical protein N7517_003548 [Penicillium concentricum]|uniref:Heterokaryon incompatibility domain-containing protein n=1 Tax=Penicillium concentricum TaxID=293559 RepID=A0A9W9S3T5_9EURO|nr:uncharacterized protein N7517_003548 [Penicillium concentricum]KAJ5371542.1 hypothetical protein N7517_003548 [Penicillium concentricum]
MIPNNYPLLEAFQKATELKLCPNRIWAVAGENLPNLLPDLDLIPGTRDKVDGHWNYPEHDGCTPDFCEHSQRDFTAVQQRHECKKKTRCMQLRFKFPRDKLEEAARNGKPTVWNLAGPSILEPPQPYMAISHVWSDGTGTGAWKDGEVNECLYEFFKDIAKQFQCEGIWWDTICIPRPKAARNKAIQKIQSSYEDARITLVHDCFLRNWTWDPKTACFAILMSPWFSRGWTALELKKSRKVKVIFKGPCGPVIKDLDEEILAKNDETDIPRKEASQIIRNLRKDITTLNDLLIALGSRYTSWPKDIATISALLVGIAREDLQQETYVSILKKFRRIAPGHLFHNSVTMSKGLDWSPTNIFNMPLDSSDPSLNTLTISTNGDIHGEWRVIPIEAELKDKCWWKNTHPLMIQKLQDALRRPQQHRLLAECRPGECRPGQETKPVERALVVRRVEGSLYKYIGAVEFHQELREKDGENCAHAKAEVIIAGMTGDRRLPSSNIERDDRSNNTVVAESPLHCAIWRGHYNTFKNLIHGDKDILDAADQFGRRPLHLAAERGHLEMVQDLIYHKAALNVQCHHGQTALHRAAWAGSFVVMKELLENEIDSLKKDKNRNTALHIAAKMGFASAAKSLLKSTDVNVKGCNDLTPLHLAAMSGHRAVAEVLKGADVEAKDNKIGWTPLHCAADNGDPELVEHLIKCGAAVNTHDDQVGWTPLHIAAITGHKAVVDLLLDKGAYSTAKDKYDWTPLQFAEMNGHAEVVELLHSEDSMGADTISAHEGFWTPLHCKAINNEHGMVKLLVDNGADVYCTNKDESWTPLQFAAENELRTAIRRLLEKGANFMANNSQPPLHGGARRGYDLRTAMQPLLNKEAKDWKKCTPLHWAAKYGREAVTRQLLEEGAEKEAQDSDGWRPLHWAVECGQDGVVRELLAAGADKEAQTRYESWSPLHRAVERGHKVIVWELLAAGADTEAMDGYCWTPLATAARHGHKAMVRELLAAGADKEARVHGMTPLHWAAEHGHKAVVRSLLAVGADKEARACDKTPLHWAAEHGHEATVRELLAAGADKEAKTSNGILPLYLATERGHEAVAHLLNASA